MRRIAGLFVLILAVLTLTSCGGGGGGGTGGGTGGGSTLGELNVVAAFAPATRLVPGYADTLTVKITPPEGVNLPQGTQSQFSLTRASSTRLLTRLVPSASPYYFEMEALTDGAVVGKVQRIFFVAAGSSEEIDVSAFLQSEIAAVQVEGSASMTLGNNMQFAAHAKNAAGQTLFSGAGFAWTSTDPTVLYVDVDTGFTIPRTPGDVTIRATLKGTAMSGSLQVNVLGDVTVSISPPSPTVQIYGQQQFSAVVNGLQNNNVTWSVDEPGGGTISASGLYTAPAVVGPYHVRATSVVYPSASGTAAVSVANDSGWTVINLHPDGALFSTANGVSGGQQVGVATFEDKYGAGIWAGTAASWTNLHPAGAAYSQGYAVDGGQQGGYALTNSNHDAALWSSSSASYVNMSPPPAIKSSIRGMHDGVQVGYAIVDNFQQASIWYGTAASWASLNPVGSSLSRANAIHSGQVVGAALISGVLRAGLWAATRDSWLSLHPAGTSQSEAFGVFAGQQVGTTHTAGAVHACLWSGTAASWVDLNPVGATDSEAYGVHLGQQVGNVVVGGMTRASLWNGSASSWVDLHAYLPPGVFELSRAKGIWHDQNFTYVVGSGINTLNQREEALLWIGPLPD